MGLLLLSMIVFWPIRVLVLSRVFYDGPYSSIFVNNEPRLKKKKKTSVGSAGEKNGYIKMLYRVGYKWYFRRMRTVEEGNSFFWSFKCYIYFIKKEAAGAKAKEIKHGFNFAW